MNLQEIQKDYISKIPKFPSLPNCFTASQLYDYFTKEIDIAEIEPIHYIRFQRKFKQFITNDTEQTYLTQKFKEITNLSQKLFDLNYMEHSEQIQNYLK